jgi:hypothetical protein
MQRFRPSCSRRPQERAAKLAPTTGVREVVLGSGCFGCCCLPVSTLARGAETETTVPEGCVVGVSVISGD